MGEQNRKGREKSQAIEAWKKYRMIGFGQNKCLVDRMRIYIIERLL